MRIGFISEFIAFHNCYKYVISPLSRLAGRNQQQSSLVVEDDQMVRAGQDAAEDCSLARKKMDWEEGLCCVVYPPVDGITTSSFAPHSNRIKLTSILPWPAPTGILLFLFTLRPLCIFSTVQSSLFQQQPTDRTRQT